METFIYFILFLLVSIVCFTIPGTFFLNKSRAFFNLAEQIILGTIIGFVIFALCSYILLILNASFILLPIIGLINILSLKKIDLTKIKFKLTSKRHFLILLSVFLIGVFGQLAIVAPSGLKINGDLVFFSSNGHDGPWHIALMEEIKKGYPLQNPIFAGEKLVNYHFFSDIAPAQFSKFFGFLNLDLYFRFFPFLLSVLLGSIAFILGRRVSNSFTCGIWSAFFVYFAGSFGYLVTFLQNRTIGGESIFWATQIQSSVGNPPQIISDILVLTFLYLMSFLYKRSLLLIGISIVVLGSLVEFKIYASVVVLISLFFVGLIELIKNKKIYILTIFILSSLLSAALYLPNSANSTSFLIFEPWWFIRTMIVVNSRLNWIDLELRRQTYISQANWKRVIQIETMGFLIFFFGNLGTRFLGLIFITKSIKNFLNNVFIQICLFIAVISLLLPLLFLQKGVATNTIQFLQYFLLVFGVFAAITLTDLQNRIKSNFLKILFIVLVIIFSVPTQIGLLYDFYHKPPLAKITSEEIQALNFLKQNTDKNNVILTPAFNKYLDLRISTPDIWAWFDTAYVSALSSRRTYLADIEQADITGYNISKRLEIEKNIFLKIENPTDMNNILKQIKIDYLYFPKILKPKSDLSKAGLKKLFDNGSTEIWKVY